MEKIILCDKWVISSIETDKPIPIRRQSEQYGSAVEGGGDRRRALWVSEVSLANDIDILGSFENGNGLDCESESVTVGLGSGEV